MDHRFFGSMLFLIVVAIVGNANAFAGYKWVSLNSSDQLPENTVLISESNEWYVGRAEYNGAILPAKINASGSAFISAADGNIILRDKFEILTTSKGCEWKFESEFGYDEYNILRVGTADNGEPIFVGYTSADHFGYIYLNNQSMHYWSKNEPEFVESKQFLLCATNTTWTKYTKEIQELNNTVSGGKSKEGDDEIHVARWYVWLDDRARIAVGQFIKKNSSEIIGNATSYLNDGRILTTKINPFYALVSEPNEYTWVSASKGVIPDFAVPINEQKYGMHQVSYVARIDNTIRKLTHPEALEKSNYDILVMSII